VKILYLCNDPSIDLAGQKGASIHIRSLVRALADLGHNVTVLCTQVSSPTSIESELHAEVRPVPLTAWNHRLRRAIRTGQRLLGRPTRNMPDEVRALHNLRFFEVATDAARKLRPDFIYERYSLWGTAGLRLAKNRSIPLALEVNAPLTFEQERYRASLTCPPLARWVERRIWRKASLLLAVSESLRSQLQTAGAKPERIQVLPNAINPGLFHPGLDGKLVRERFKLHGRFVAGFVGTFKGWHGVDLLLSAFQDLHRADPSTHLLLVGDGPLRPGIEEEVRKAGLQDAVTFAGGMAHQDVPHYLAAMDVAIAPYPALEDFYFSPLKVFEYMAAGRAVVASRIGQVAEVVVDGVTGLLYEPGDRAGLVNCIQRLQKDVLLRNKLGRKASAASSVRTWSHNAARVIDWVEPLANRNALLPRLAEADGEELVFEETI